MFLMGNDFSTWINKELQERDWSQSDLARASGLHRATISKLLSYADQVPSPETLNGIAKAFNYPPEYVLRQAGLLPPEMNSNPALEEANQLLSELPKEYQKQALQLIRFLHDTHVPYNTKKANKTSS